MEHCPTCRARLTATEAVCPRCRSDLSQLWRLEARAQRHCLHAIQHSLRDADAASAANAVKEALRLKREPLYQALRCFLQHKQEQQALQHLVAGDYEHARDALAIALSLGNSRFAVALQGFIGQQHQDIPV